MSVNNTTQTFTGTLAATNQTSISYTRADTVATITNEDHGLVVGDSVFVTASSDTDAIPLGYYTVVSVVDADTFTITCPDAGATSGETITYDYFLAIDFDGILIKNFVLINDDASDIDLLLNKTTGQYNFITVKTLESISISADIGSVKYKSGNNAIDCRYIAIGVDTKR